MTGIIFPAKFQSKVSKIYPECLFGVSFHVPFIQLVWLHSFLRLGPICFDGNLRRPCLEAQESSTSCGSVGELFLHCCRNDDKCEPGCGKHSYCKHYICRLVEIFTASSGASGTHIHTKQKEDLNLLSTFQMDPLILEIPVPCSTHFI